MKKIIFIAAILFAWHHFYYIADAPELGPGMIAAGEPFQTEPSINRFREGDYTYNPRADFEIEARVLSASRYYFDQEARISPMDLALGWGAMSDEDVINQIDIWQEDRWYKWESDHLPIPKSEIISSSANMHIVPANKKVEKELKKIRNGDLVRIKGYLVDVKSSTGWRWKTSTVRTDSGQGACELIYAQELELLDPYERIAY